MRISVVPFELDMQDAAGRLRGHDERPSGMHLSDVVRDFAARTIFKGDARRKRVKFAQLTDAERRRMANYVELGFAWEWIFERAFEERQLRRVAAAMAKAKARAKTKAKASSSLDRNVVLKKDGLWMSPDAVDEAAWELWEFKLTWKTARRLDKPSDIASDPAFAEWLMQIKGYLHGLRMTVCNLIVFFVNGDYREPRVPKPAHLRLVFDKGELVENWTKIQNHKRTMEREARAA